MSKYRLSIDLAPEARKELPKLQKKSGCANLIDLIRTALAVFEMLVDFHNEGGKLIFEDKDGKKETVRFLNLLSKTKLL